jgi:hypothetical protein
MTATRIVTVPDVHPVFQVAIGDADVTVGQARYDTARYDVYPEATYSGLDALWADDSCDAIDAATFYGRQRSIDAFDVGTATFRVANPHGYWDFPPASGTPLTLRPGRMVRVGVVVGANAPDWLWTGWIDGTEPGYDPTVGDVVTVHAVCAKGEAGRVDVARLTTATGAGENAPSRIGRLAGIAGFPAHRQWLDPSGTTLLATALGGRVGQLMDDAARSAGGDVFGDESGWLVFRGRDWQASGIGRTPDAAIGNRGVPGEICPGAWEVSFHRSDFTSRVVYGRSGETAFQMDDPTNQARYGVETWTMTNMQTQSDTVLNDLAWRALQVRNFDRAPRVAAVTVDAARPGVVELLRTASPFTPSMYVCGLVARDGRAVFTRNLYLTGITHAIDAAHWTARLALDDATPWLVTADTRYDTARYDTDVYTTAA